MNNSSENPWVRVAWERAVLRSKTSGGSLARSQATHTRARFHSYRASQRDMKAPQDLYRQLLLQPVNVDEFSLESASIFLMLGRSFVGYRLVGQQAVSLILEVQQNVVIGFGAHDHLISRREVVVSLSVQMFPKLDQILRG